MNIHPVFTVDCVYLGSEDVPNTTKLSLYFASAGASDKGTVVPLEQVVSLTGISLEFAPIRVKVSQNLNPAHNLPIGSPVRLTLSPRSWAVDDRSGLWFSLIDIQRVAPKQQHPKAS